VPELRSDNREVYCEVLGLHVKSNAPYTAAQRWLTVVSLEDRDGGGDCAIVATMRFCPGEES
jgi:hypothetical protein